MPEENNETTDKESKQNSLTKEVPDNVLKISLDTNAQVERLQQQLEQKTAKIAVMEYEKNNRYGLPNPPVGGDTAPLNPTDDYRPNNKSSDSDNWQTKQYPSYEDAIIEIAKHARMGDKDALRYQADIYKKNFSGNWEYAFDFDVNDGFGSKALYKKPIEIKPSMSESEKQAIQDYNHRLRKALKNWKKIE